MTETANDQKWKRQTVKSFRMNASNLELVKQECAKRNLSIFRFCTTVADGEFETHATPSYRGLGQIAVVIQAREGV